MFCRKCGSQIKDNALFCYQCGERVKINSEVVSDGKKDGKVRLGQNPALNRKTSGVLPLGKFPLVF